MVLYGLFVPAKQKISMPERSEREPVDERDIKSEHHLEYVRRGGGAEVYLEIRPDGQKLAKKIFDPSMPAIIGYRAFRWKDHPYKADYAPYVVKGAYALRRVAHRVAQAFNLGVEVVDSIELCSDELGFYSPFIENASEYSPSMDPVKRSLNVLEQKFWSIGLPVWSFGGGYFKEERRKDNVLVDESGLAHLIDYEAGWPYFNRRDLVGFDDVDIPKFQRFLVLGQQTLEVRLGRKKYLELMESWEKYQLYSNYWRSQESALIKKIQQIKEALDWRSLNDRINQLRSSGVVSSEKAAQMSIVLNQNTDILNRLAPHFVIQFLISAPLRFPLGTLGRTGYITAMRVINEVAALIHGRKEEKIQIHDGKVLFLSAVPIYVPPFAFFAYLSKVLDKEPLSYLILDNLFFSLSGKGLEQQMASLGNREKVKALIEIKDGEGIRSDILRKLVPVIEKVMTNLLTEEVVQKAKENLRRGSVSDVREEKDLTNDESFIKHVESVISDKYKKLT